MKKLMLTAAVMTFALAPAMAFASDKPPAASKSLASIAQSLQQQGYTLAEVSFDDGRWEAEAYKGSQKFEIHLDAKTGKILSSHPDH